MNTTRPVSQETTPRLNPDESDFLQAWKQGVQLAGTGLFYCRTRSPETACHWRQLIPKLDLMRKAVANRSKGEACLIACMASLYNAEEGQRLMNKAGATFGDMALAMRQEQRQLVATLLMYYPGW